MTLLAIQAEGLSCKREIIAKFQKHLSSAVDKISRDYICYSQKNKLNFLTDIIKLPTGDGAALVFTFDGLERIAIDFSLEIMRQIDEFNTANACEKYASQGWCNCHDSYDIRLGIADGKCILYKDVNDRMNVAGSPINTAARVMSKGDAKQILLTKAAHDNIIDMANDVALDDKFRAIGEGLFKHGLKLDIYQYADEGAVFINSSKPAEMETLQKLDHVMSTLGLDQMFKRPQVSSASDALKAVSLLSELANQIVSKDDVYVPLSRTRRGGRTSTPPFVRPWTLKPRRYSQGPGSPLLGCCPSVVGGPAHHARGDEVQWADHGARSGHGRKSLLAVDWSSN